MLVEVYRKVWCRWMSKFSTMSRALNTVFLHNMMTSQEIQHGGRPPFWKSLYIHISATNRPNTTKFGMRTQILNLSTEMWERFRNSQIQDGGRTPYWKSFFGYNSAPYCPIKTKFGVRRHNRMCTKAWWWKCQISEIQHGGRPPVRYVTLNDRGGVFPAVLLI